MVLILRVVCKKKLFCFVLFVLLWILRFVILWLRWNNVVSVASYFPTIQK